MGIGSSYNHLFLRGAITFHLNCLDQVQLIFIKNWAYIKKSQPPKRKGWFDSYFLMPNHVVILGSTRTVCTHGEYNPSQQKQ